jgi:hypothetical protein
LYRTRHRLLYQGVLLLQPDLALVGEYLEYPPREPDYRLGRSHEEFVTALASGVPELTPAGVAAALVRELGRLLPAGFAGEWFSGPAQSQ